MPRAIGLHIRIEHSMLDVMQQAITLQLPLVQCFLIDQKTKQYIKITESMRQAWFSYQQNNVVNVFIHATYWINIASAIQHSAVSMLQREIMIAQQLGCNYVVVHPGAANGFIDRLEGIDQVAYTINYIQKRNPSCVIVLENTAHGHASIGSDITDFALLKKKLSYPERIRYCIDTAHAFAYGYDIVHQQGRDAFIALVQEAIGWHDVILVHLNDTKEQLGQRLDQHAVPGQGSIGLPALQAFAQHPLVVDKPLLFELPASSLEEQNLLLQRLRTLFN